MGLIGIKDISGKLDRELLLYTFDHLPSLIIDCSNSANPHAIFPHAPLEKFCSVYVIEVEMLYKFRDVLKMLKKLANDVNASTIIITTFSHLFNYQDEIENNQIFEQCWLLMKSASENLKIIVGVHKTQEKLAKMYCDKLFEGWHYGSYSLEPKDHGRHYDGGAQRLRKIFEGEG